jgi:methylenetetrahydrofolate dehydrogenase (NADP+)/methenyltetrahydrofolate cyclohydrolase
MEILDGKKAAQAIKDELKIEVAQLAAEGKKVPHLAAILVGSDGASETYVAAKVKACEEVGFKSTLIRFEESISTTKLLDKIQELNTDPDVDGFHPVNVGKMLQGLPGFVPATPHGIMLLIKHYKIDTKGKHAVVIGRSNIVGRPMSVLLSANSNPGNCTVTICHSQTKNIKEFCLQADIIVAALGKPEFITADMVKEGAIIIDVGITREIDTTKKSGFRLKGDVAFETVAPKCSWITPVPGGVGPMTIAALMRSTYKSCTLKN